MQDARQEGEAMDGAVLAAAAPLEALSVSEPREKEEANLVVPFKIDLDGEICARMVQALVKYLLYLRGQIPCVYDEFYAFVRRQRLEEEAARATGTRKRKLMSGAVKKARKLVDQADHLLEQSLMLMFQRRVKTVAIVFGSTIASPREVWRIDFHHHPGSNTERATIKSRDGVALSRDRVLQLCVQKMIRSVLSYATHHFSSSVSMTSLHLLVLAETSDVPVEAFVPKQQFRLRIPKARTQSKRTHSVLITHGTTTDPTSTNGDQGEEVNKEFVWYQSSRPLQGVRRLS